MSRALDENGVGAPASGAADIPADAWYAANVNGLLAAGILKPDDFPGNYFLPTLPISRAEIATRIGRAAVREKIQASLPDPGFGDIAGKQYRDEIVTAARTGIVNGYPDGTFRPDDAVTRAEAAAMMHRLVTRMTEGAPDVALLARINQEMDAVLTWADQQRDPRMATNEGLAPHLQRYLSPMLFAGNVAERGWFLRNPAWYSESRHVEEQPILLARTVAITISGGLHRVRHDNGAWEVDRGWSGRGWYNWYRKINGRWVSASGKTYDPDPNNPLFQLPPFYHPERYNQGPRPDDIGSDYWGEDGVMVYDPGPNPPETARFGITNAQGVVEKWEPSIQP